jgi:hypothetical protein
MRRFLLKRDRKIKMPYGDSFTTRSGRTYQHYVGTGRPWITRDTGPAAFVRGAIRTIAMGAAGLMYYNYFPNDGGGQPMLALPVAASTATASSRTQTVTKTKKRAITVKRTPAQNGYKYVGRAPTYERWKRRVIKRL